MKASLGIMTTDTQPKMAMEKCFIGNSEAKIFGIAKGSGMIAPDMATMLVYIFTDASISKKLLQKVVSELVEKTFNCITVDSDTSTSDTLLVAATGKSGISPINSINSDSYKTFKAGLEKVMLNLCHQVVKDGEGATKLIHVKVSGAENSSSAKKIARSIADSPLVKTAIGASDPNWGRIIMAIGKAGPNINLKKLSLKFGNIKVVTDGKLDQRYDEKIVANYMKNENINLEIEISTGIKSFTAYTMDFTSKYIKINADYRS